MAPDVLVKGKLLDREMDSNIRSIAQNAQKQYSEERYIFPSII
jgi:hypothetical protein